MSKFKLSCIYISCFFLLNLFLISFFLNNSKVKQSNIKEEINTHKTITIKAKKSRSKKTIVTSNKEETFSCFVDRSTLSIIFDKKNIETKELLLNLKGDLSFKELSQIMFFKGSEGIIDYKNLSLSIQNCLFYVQDKDHNKNNINNDNLFDSGMKSISISLKNLNLQNF